MTFFSPVNGIQWHIPTIAQGIGLVVSLALASVYFSSKAVRSRRLRRLTNKRGDKIPNGPRGLPVFGSWLSLIHYPELTLDYWAKKYGPIYSMWLGNQLVVVISDPHIVKDLMITNGAIFSSRRDAFLKCKTVFKGRAVTASPYNNTWRKHRRIAMHWLNPRAVDEFTHALDFEATVMVQEMYKYGGAGKTPINPEPHAGRCSLNNMLTLVFGIRTATIEDPLVATALRLSRDAIYTSGAVSNLTDFIPLLQRIPNYMISHGKKLHSDLMETYGGLIKDMEAKLKRGESVPECLVKTMLTTQEEEELDLTDMAMLASAFMIGGMDSTSAMTQWCSAVISAYPEIQAKAHAELDRVVGRDRLPTLEDEKDLPYIHAIIKEVGRYHNPFWLGTPHLNTTDFSYRGYFIPKDTEIVVNAYTMHHDPQRHPNPHKFDPERYINDASLSSESAHLADPDERDHWVFGVGRRICPGILVAERDIFLGVSRMLWAFKMETLANEPIDLKEYDGPAGRSPAPFRIRMIPRHDNVAKVLEI